jgi:hypothetical protein
MSTLPGVSVTSTNVLVSSQGVPPMAIALIGHVGATLPGTVRKFTSSVDGDVLSYTNLSDAITGLGGRCDGTGWVPGVPDAGSGATSPRDSKDNLLRSLDLVYYANSGAKVYCCVLDGVGTPLTGTSSIPAGAQRALDVLLNYQDIGYVILCNINPISAGKSHAEAAASANSTYNSPRFYVTGIDLFTVWDATNNGGAALPLNSADLSFLSTHKSAEGLVMNYIGNHQFDFTNSVNSTDTTKVIVEIGGQLTAAWLAGVLSAQLANFSITNYPALAPSRYNGFPYIFKETELVDAIAGGFIITRYKNNSYVLTKGVTFSSVTGWMLYSHRQITNVLHKAMTINLDQFIGKPKTTSLLVAAKVLLDSILGEAKEALLISEYTTSVKDHPSQVDAIQAKIFFVTVKPVNKIFITFMVS